MSATVLSIARELILPIDAVTQTFGILAKRRAGKSYTARRFAEQLFEAGQQIVIVDPKGDWWGIRSSADGKSPGLPIVILGGEHGDVRLESGGGELVAKLVVEERVSLALDLSEFRKHEVATFMTGFLEALYRLKARENYRTPVMLIIDEADAVAPQRPQKGEERMLGAAEDIVRRGGQRGIGCTMVTQRAAVLNKNVLTQIQMLVAMRTIAPQDLDAAKAWIDVHGTQEQRATLMESLPALPVGDAWFWSPGWPTESGIFKRAHVLPIETFDSGATPKSGEKRVEPRNLADVDLEALKTRMAATIERAKADDPRELKAQIAALKKELAAKPKGEIDESAVVRAIEREREKCRGIVNRLRAAMFFWNTQLEEVTQKASNAVQAVGRFGDEFFDEIAADIEKTKAGVAQSEERLPRKQRVVGSTPSVSTISDGNLGKGERIVLTAVAQYQDGADREMLTILTGYKRSTRDAYLQRLREKGLIVVDGDRSIATEGGIATLGADFQPLPTGADLRNYWINRLPMGELVLFEILCERYPDVVSRDDLSQHSEYKRSTRDAYLQRLGARRLIEITRDGVRASAMLF